jgi:hypothetical protein
MAGEFKILTEALNESLDSWQEDAWKRIKDEPERLKIVQLIEKDCKPFLKHKKMLWRSGRTHRGFFGTAKPKKNRVPRDTPVYFHDFINEYLKSKGLPDRANSTFATTNGYDAGYYGTPSLIFPKGDFKFLWFPETVDAFQAWYPFNRDDLIRQKTYFERNGRRISYHDELEKIFKGKGAPEQRINNAIKFFKDTKKENYNNSDWNDFDLAIAKLTNMKTELKQVETKRLPTQSKKERNEILIDCKDYYYVKAGKNDIEERANLRYIGEYFFGGDFTMGLQLMN